MGAWRWGGFSSGVVSWLGDATAGMPWDGTGGGVAIGISVIMRVSKSSKNDRIRLLKD